VLVKQHKLKFSKGKATSEIIYGACWHIGNPNADIDAVGVFIESARRQPWWHAGDVIEAIGPGDKRFQHSEHKDTMLNQIAIAGDTLAVASRTCLGLITGNHEWGASGRLGDIAEDIANRAKVPNLGACCFFDIVCPKGKAIIFAAHGKGSMGFNSGFPERDDVNRRMKLRRILDGFSCDASATSSAKCVAHYHRTIIDPARYKYAATVEGGKFKRRAVELRESWVMACPSLFGNYGDGPTSYAEIALYPPTDLGWLGISFERSGRIACVREYTPNGNISQEIEEDVMR